MNTVSAGKCAPYDAKVRCIGPEEPLVNFDV